MQMLLSALREIDLLYFYLIITGNHNPYIICSKNNSSDIISDKHKICLS